MNHNMVAVYKDITLRPLAKDDIESLRIWRNNPKNTEFLTNIGEISPEQQNRWFEKYLQDDTEAIFAIVDNRIAKGIVGSVSLYGINHGMAEVGKILIGDSRAHGRGIGRKALVMAMLMGFKNLSLGKIVGAVSPDNIQAYTNDMKVGFQITGEHTLDNGILEKEIEINIDELTKANDYVADVRLCTNGKRFYVGQADFITKKITETDVCQYAEACGDKNPIHLNEEYAKKSKFGRRICHGMLTGSLISNCIGTKFPGEGSIYLSQNLKFVKPVDIDEECTATCSVTFIDNEKKFLYLDTIVTNSRNEQVITGTAVVLVDEL